MLCVNVHMERALRSSTRTMILINPWAARQTARFKLLRGLIWECGLRVRVYRSICTAVLCVNQRFDQASGDAGWQSELAVASCIIVIIDEARSEYKAATERMRIAGIDLI